MIRKIALFCLLSVCALAEEIDYTILNISEVTGKHWIAVDKEPRSDCPTRLEVKLRASHIDSSAYMFATAYFYDRNKNLIYSYNKPCSVGGEKVTYARSGFPNTLTDNVPFDVYFAVTPEIQKKHPNAVLIAFGDGKTVCVKAKGSADPMDFEFPEKARFIASKK